MKKFTISLLLLFFAFGVVGQTLNIQPQSPVICQGNGVALTVPSSGSNYQWSPNAGLSATTGDTVLASPTITTVYTVTGLDSGKNVTGTDTILVLNPLPLIIQPQSPSVCSGQCFTLTASGGTSYTWSPSTTLNSSTGDTVVACPTATTTYTVTTTGDSLGCNAAFVVVVSILPPPNKPTIAQNGNVLISSATEDDQWIRNDTVLFGATNQTYTIIVSGWYQVIATNPANGCSSASDSIYVGPTSTALIQPQNPIICMAGLSVTLTVPASGSGYVWSPSSTLNSATGDTVVALPIVTTTYTVTGYDSLGHYVTGTDVVTIGTPPAMPIIFLSQTGDSIASSASGNNQWLLDSSIIQGATNQIYVPNMNGWYQVQVTSPSSCTSTSNPILINRQSVWPGDANDDLVVNNYDLIPIGLYYGYTGTPRDSVTNEWAAQSCTDWDSIQANGINMKYADCNGDGSINDLDTVAISLNYGLHHPLDGPRQSSERTSGTVPLSIIPDSSSYHAGSVVHASVILGANGNSATNIYGLAYDISLNNSIITPGTISFNYASSFLGDKGSNALTLTRINNDVETAIVGIDHLNKNGYGKIGDLYFTLNSSSDSAQLRLFISSYEAVDAKGNQIGLSVATGIRQLTVSNNKISIYPNPTSGKVTIVSEKSIDNIKVTNVLGQLVYEAQPKQLNFNIELKDNGMYFITITSNNETGTQKIMVIR